IDRLLARGCQQRTETLRLDNLTQRLAAARVVVRDQDVVVLVNPGHAAHLSAIAPCSGLAGGRVMLTGFTMRDFFLPANFVPPGRTTRWVAVSRYFSRASAR